MLILLIINVGSIIINPDSIAGIDEALVSSAFGFAIAFIISIVFFAISVLTWLITTIVILATNWKSKWAREHKLLWGLLSLLLLGWIAMLIFGSIGKNHAREESDNLNSYNPNSHPQYPYSPYQPQSMQYPQNPYNGQGNYPQNSYTRDTRNQNSNQPQNPWARNDFGGNY